MALQDSSYMSQLLQNLWEMQKDCVLTDVVLLSASNSRQFCAHRVVLACGSEYFRIMFCGGATKWTEATQSEIRIDSVSDVGLEAVIDYLYTSSVILTSRNITEILQAANFFQIDRLLQWCIDYIRSNITLANAFQFRELGLKLGIDVVFHLANSFILNHFIDIADEDFVQLPIETLIDFIRDQHLKVVSELELCEKVLKWISHKPSRARLAPTLLKHIKFPLMSTQDLCTIKKVLDSNPQIPTMKIDTMIRTAFIFHASPLNQIAMKYSGTQLRKSNPLYMVSILRFSNPSTPDKLMRLNCSDEKSNSSEYNLTSGSLVTNDSFNVQGRLNENDSADHNSTWSDISNLPFLYRMTSQCNLIQLHNYLFLVANSVTLRFDPRFETWLTLPEMPLRRYSDFKVFTLLQEEPTGSGDEFFVIGGRNEENEEIKTVSGYNVRKNEWFDCEIELSFLPTDFAICSYLGGFVLISGGYLNLKLSTSIYKFRLTEGLKQIGDMTLPRSNHSMVYCKGLIYIFGGVDLARVDVFDPVKQVIMKTFDIVGIHGGINDFTMILSYDETCIHVMGGFHSNSLKQNKAHVLISVDNCESVQIKNNLPDNCRILNCAWLRLKSTTDSGRPLTKQSQSSS